MTETRYDVVLDVVKAHHDHGRTRSEIHNSLTELILDEEGRDMVWRALREVFDGIRCEHPANEPCNRIWY